MKTQIVTIGNSQGVRIPKTLLEQSKLSREVELEVCDEGILIRSTKKPRENWDEAFKQAAGCEDDEIIGGNVQNRFDEEEWEW